MEMPDNMQTSNNRIVICLNGEKPDEGLLRTAMENAYIIAADGACRYLCDFGIKADCVVGDFDSFEFDRLSSALRPGGRLIRSIPEKDYTDGQMALKEALDMNPGDIVILGALGGRTDHEQENLRLLCAANENCSISILTRNERIFIINSEKTLYAAPGTTISLLPYTDTAEVALAEGFRYPMDGLMLSRCDALSLSGLSNIMLNGRAYIRLKRGLLLAIMLNH